MRGLFELALGDGVRLGWSDLAQVKAASKD